MRLLRKFGEFWYDFIVGDDWRIAVGVIVILLVTDLLSHAGVPMWWFIPLAMTGVAAFSLRRASRG